MKTNIPCSDSEFQEACRASLDFRKTENTGALPPIVSAEPFIDKTEMIRRLDCGMRTLDSWIKAGLVPYYKIGRTVRFRWSEVQDFLNKNCRVNLRGS